MGITQKGLQDILDSDQDKELKLGMILRRHREGLSIPVSSVAQKLKTSEKRINDLESGIIHNGHYDINLAVQEINALSINPTVIAIILSPEKAGNGEKNSESRVSLHPAQITHEQTLVAGHTTCSRDLVNLIAQHNFEPEEVCSLVGYGSHYLYDHDSIPANVVALFCIVINLPSTFIEKFLHQHGFHAKLLQPYGKLNWLRIIKGLSIKNVATLAKVSINDVHAILSDNIYTRYVFKSTLDKVQHVIDKFNPYIYWNKLNHTNNPLKRIQLRHFMTAKQLANKSHVNYAAILAAEDDQGHLNQSQLHLVARVFNISPQILVNYQKNNIFNKSGEYMNVFNTLIRDERKLSNNNLIRVDKFVKTLINQDK